MAEHQQRPRLWFCVDSLDEEAVGRLRARQMEAVTRLSPLLIFCNIVNATVLAVTFAPTPSARPLIWWSLAAVALSLWMLIGWRRNRFKASRERASRQGVRKMTIIAGVHGCLWAIPGLASLTPNNDQTLILAMMITALMGHGLLALASIPTASLAYAAPIAVSGLVFVTVHAGEHLWVMITLYLNYIFIVGVIACLAYQSFVNRFLAEIRNEEMQLADAEAARMQRQRAQHIEAHTEVFAQAVSLVLQRMGAVSSELKTSSRVLVATADHVEASSRSATRGAAVSEAAVGQSVEALDLMRRTIDDIAQRTALSVSVGREALDRTSDTVNAVSAVANAAIKIDGVVSVIQGIAKPTNLLALNATIEAARAGSALPLLLERSSCWRRRPHGQRKT